MQVIGIAGAGFSGAVIARQLVENCTCRVVVFDSRSHIGGNCHTERDQKTGILKHVYGPHIFHTSNEDVWAFVNRFSEFKPYTHTARAKTHNGMFSLPVNLLTINQLFGTSMSPSEAQVFIKKLAVPIESPKNFEEQALSMFGSKIYETFFRGYTRKQWGEDPKNLSSSILKRLPVRFNYCDKYFSDKYEGMPVQGYSKLIENILDHPNIEVRLKQTLLPSCISNYDHVFYSGPIDAFFGYELGALRYRSLKFEEEITRGDFQGTAIVNYCEEEVPFTRITEHKHFSPWESHADTIIYREYSEEWTKGKTPYYPIRLNADKKMLSRYIERAKLEKGVTFVGRLGTYRYLDMHRVIDEALLISKFYLEQTSLGKSIPVFFTDPLTGEHVSAPYLRAA